MKVPQLDYLMSDVEMNVKKGLIKPLKSLGSSTPAVQANSNLHKVEFWFRQRANTKLSLQEMKAANILRRK